MSFLGAIPGLLPMVALLILAGAILVIPAVVVGALIGLPVLLARAALRRMSARRHRRNPVATAALTEPGEHPAYTPPATRTTAPVA